MQEPPHVVLSAVVAASAPVETAPRAAMVQASACAIIFPMLDMPG
jgi:hypothetical protein